MFLAGKVVIDAFRLTDPRMQAMGHEPRQTTSNLGHLHKPSIQALIHGLGRHYYSLPINYRKNELEQRVSQKSKNSRSDIVIHSHHAHTHINLTKNATYIANHVTYRKLICGWKAVM